MRPARTLALLPLLLLVGCASEAELACQAARAGVEEQYRNLGAGAAVALLLLLCVGFLARHPVRPATVPRAVGAVLTFLPALGAVALLGLMLGQITGQSTRQCSPEDGIFSEGTGGTFFLVVVGVISVGLLALSTAMCVLAWTIWRSRPARSGRRSSG